MSGTPPPPWTIKDRVEAVLQGQKPDRIPFIDRMSIWYKHHSQLGTLPSWYQGMTLNAIHRAVGIGQLIFLPPYALRLRGTEVVVSFEGETIYRETDPVVDSYPHLRSLAVADRPGITSIELLTPLGKLRIQHQIVQSMINQGLVPYLREHLVKEEADCRAVEYILDRAEYIPLYDQIYQTQAALEGSGYVVPNIDRIPFQQVLLEYLGEQALFYALYDNPGMVHRLMQVLDQHIMEILSQLTDLKWLYIEFGDNLDGMMTNPKLFAEYCLPYYQRYAEILHRQGKAMGSHTDGNLRPLLALIAESGLDVCESVATYPLTPYRFEEIWEAWQEGPIIWGGIPSPILEERTDEDHFRDHVRGVLATVDYRPIILGVSDMVLGNNLIERVRYIAEQVDAWPNS